MRNRIGPLLPVAAIAVVAVLGFAAPLVAADDECGACHEEVVTAFATTNHGRTFAADRSHAAAGCWHIKERYRTMRGYKREQSALNVSRLIAHCGNHLEQGLHLADLMP